MITVLNMYGGPGVGKSTQAQLLIDRKGFVTVPTGDIIRECTPGYESPYGERYRSLYADALSPYIDLPKQGQHIPDSIMMPILTRELTEFITQGKKRIVLPGSIKSRSQAESLQAYLDLTSDQELLNYKVINYVADDTLLIQRMRQRRLDTNRPDDLDFRPLLEKYHEVKGPLLDYYREKGLLTEVTVDESKRVEELFRETVSIVEGASSNPEHQGNPNPFGIQGRK